MGMKRNWQRNLHGWAFAFFSFAGWTLFLTCYVSGYLKLCW